MNKNLVMLVLMVVLSVGVLGASTVVADVSGLYGSGNRDQVNQALVGGSGSGSGGGNSASQGIGQSQENNQ
jgi:hypothetical protein